MRIRQLLTLLALLALVARLVSPCEAMASRSVDAPNAPIAKCHLLASAPSLAKGDADQAPAGDMDRDEGCACALCQIGWSAPPPADAVFAIRGVEHNLAPRAPPTQAFVPSRPNRSAPPRGPPSFV
ncbi:hypothetical protein IYY11_14645 [Methylocystis sp. H62]|jgi:hypothetical protein|uniref:hypothetical protein n=1 Tax=Methylocystis sp. H62 TaxID=2785789 RepID=UPI0018C3093B|nr:hypothetical protein [Methylocystis sp. H62]MBG0794591.1 hypothetical protein [Methylocystis sp. H62]